ncbi:Para-nitrobenzyl esterase [Cladobotryum mycophilum]|uniref:Carboxylic ester hydrolase n=1 Tax=Cladobotryum mycophilum TaxID=491253 RepID=A0ABR0S8G5_9HYPO
MSSTKHAHHPVVRVDQGTLVGVTEENCHRFLGIPYAAPPVGSLRWHAPLPPAVWEGQRDATKFAPSALQTIDRGLPPDIVTSEDCLYLNVWSKSLDASAKQPVMFWIHGGGFLNGSSSMILYHGGPLAQHGVTFVSINYRLGAFGFLRHPDAGGNFAVLDWVAALKWVSKNIRNFGGDPNNVTVFGESAGAVAVRTLLSTPSAHDLFHRAIIQSAGCEPSVATSTPSLERVISASDDLFAITGTRDLEALRSIPAEEIRAASFAASGLKPTNSNELHAPADLRWYPVSDGAVITDEFVGWADNVPVLFGFTADEARCFYRPDSVLGQPQLTPALAYTAGAVGRMTGTLGADRAAAVAEYYASQNMTPYEAIVDFGTAAWWSEPALATYNRFARLPNRTSYFYRFSRVSPATRRSKLLALHTAELPYLFGPMTRRTAWRPWGDMPSAVPETEAPEDRDFDSDDVRVSAEMQEAWVQFAKNGVPRNGDKEWPRCTVSDQRFTDIGDEVQWKQLEVGPIERLIGEMRK